MIPNILILFSSMLWFYLFFLHGRKPFSNEPYFWSTKIIFEKYINYEILRKKLKKPDVIVVIPARNEEKNISLTIKSLLKQKEQIKKIILVNDQSSDNTVLIAKNLFYNCKFQRYKILDTKFLPEGWSGKLWSLEQGVNEAIKDKKNNYLLLVDADITLEENVIHNLKKTLINRNLFMISLMAKLNCSHFWEKLLIPSFIFFFQKIYPFNIVNKKTEKIAAAAGGCIFCKQSLFEKKSLFEKIKHNVIDDCNLAKLIKNKGAIWLGLTNKVHSTREYKSLGSIWNMVSRCAYEQLHNSPLYLFFSIVGLFLIYLAWPVGFIYYFSEENFILSLQNYINFCLLFILFLITTTCYFPTTRFYKVSKFFTLFLPISALFYITMTISSSFNYHFKNGNEWKGRKYRQMK